jgi:hypothetical protein
MTLPCGETIGHGEKCSSFWLCSDCREKLDLILIERAAVVAWLRSQGGHHDDIYAEAADDIERGAHHGKVTE